MRNTIATAKMHDIISKQLLTNKSPDGSSEKLRVKNKTVSVGIIAITPNLDIIFLRRKAPYFVCDHFMRKKYFNVFDYLQNTFDNDKSRWLRHYRITPMNKVEEIEVDRYLNNEIFEDSIDFPHGRIKKRALKNFVESIEFDQIRNLPEETLIKLFTEAYREFEEETGYGFRTLFDPKNHKIFTIEFLGLDNRTYRQIYFVCRNVYLYKSNRRRSYYDTQFQPVVQNIKDVYREFVKHDTIYRKHKANILKQLL